MTDRTLAWLAVFFIGFIAGMVVMGVAIEIMPAIGFGLGDPQ